MMCGIMSSFPKCSEYKRDNFCDAVSVHILTRSWILAFSKILNMRSSRNTPDLTEVLSYMRTRCYPSGATEKKKRAIRRSVKDNFKVIL